MELTNNATKEFYSSSKEIVGVGCDKAKDFTVQIYDNLLETSTSVLSSLTSGAAYCLQFCFSSFKWASSSIWNILNYIFLSIQTICGTCFSYLKSVPYLLYSST